MTVDRMATNLQTTAKNSLSFLQRALTNSENGQGETLRVVDLAGAFGAVLVFPLQTRGVDDHSEDDASRDEA